VIRNLLLDLDNQMSHEFSAYDLDYLVDQYELISNTAAENLFTEDVSKMHLAFKTHDKEKGFIGRESLKVVV
jgi:sulfur relay (sulfurtransferase) DsrF/TusC family protein